MIIGPTLEWRASPTAAVVDDMWWLPYWMSVCRAFVLY
jgi:hypothetical protein